MQVSPINNNQNFGALKNITYSENFLYYINKDTGTNAFKKIKTGESIIGKVCNKFDEVLLHFDIESEYPVSAAKRATVTFKYRNSAVKFTDKVKALFNKNWNIKTFNGAWNGSADDSLKWLNIDESIMEFFKQKNMPEKNEKEIKAQSLYESNKRLMKQRAWEAIINS